MAHGFAFTNKLVVHDDVEYLFQKGADVSSGRWFLPILSAIFPDFSMPWIYGIITIVLFALSACIIVQIFDVKNPVLKGLTGALIVSFSSLTGVFGYMFTSTSYGVCFLMIFTIMWLSKKVDAFKKLFMILLIVFYPASVNCLVVLFRIESLHTLTKFSYVTLFLLVVVFIDRMFIDEKTRFIRICREISSIVLVCVVAANIYIANEAYLDLKLRYENVYSYFTQITAQIKMQPEYKKDTKVAVMGKTENSMEFYMNFGNVNKIAGVSSVTPNMSLKEKFFEYYIGFDGNFATATEMQKLSKTDEFQQMPTYPDYGSIKYIDNCIVVKFGNEID